MTCMKFSEPQMEILSLFMNINPSIMFKPGQKVSTISNNRNILGSCTFKDVEFESKAPIYDLGNMMKTIKVLSRNNTSSPEVEFNTNRVEISNNGADFSASGTRFAYTSAARAALLTPSRGPVTGATRVTIAGSGFADRQQLQCRFGSARVPASLVDDSSVVCVAPAVPAAADAQVYVTDTSSNADVAGPLTYVYDAAARVSAVVPSFGGVRGSTAVSVQGESFTAGAVCRLSLIHI